MKKLFYFTLFLVFIFSPKSHAENICSATSSTADSGTIYDSGGPGGNYGNYENCGFLIQPASSPNNITLSFSQFIVDNGYDFLYVYDGTNTSGTLLGTFTGYSLPSDVTATTGSMYLRFTSDYYFSNQTGFTASWTSSTATTPANLKASYTFDACSLATSVEDSQGTFHGTATGSDSTDTSSISGGRSLDLSATGTTDWVTLPKSVINGINDFSVSVWIKTGTSSNEQNILQALGSSTDDDELQIYLNYSNTVILKLKDNDETLSANTTLTDNVWHHLVITRQSGTVCLYVDGSQTDCDTGASTGALSVSYDNSVVIGQEQDSIRNSPALNSGFDSSQSFKGLIDELKIYQSTLNSTQVQTLYNAENSAANTASCTAELKASYNFDDDWVTNNSLTDQTGGYNGIPSGSISRVTAAASGSKGDTCYAASFTGGDVDITGLPVSTSTGAKTSVSFWMYWDGTNSVMPMGWYQHDLWLVSGAFGFNTWSNDVTGISSSGLASGWHHVAAVFTNGSVANNKLYIDGNQQSISAIYGSANTGNAVVQSALRMGGVTSTSGYRFRGQLDNFKIYTGEITQAQVSADMNASNACAGGGDTAATAFNCVETGANGISGKLYTKTTGQSFSYDVVALQDASTVETSFASGADHTVTVELVDASSGSCTTYAALNPAVTQSLTFTAADAGNKTSAAMTSSNAYRNIKCRVTDATDSPSVVGCSSDAFAIRPTGFTVTSNLTNTTDTGTPKAKTGENFTLTATATVGYDGTPAIDSGKIQPHAGAPATGNLSGTFNAASAATGIGSGTSFTYSEVGSIRFAAEGIYDSSFTAIDQSADCTNDFSNAVISGKVGCKFGNVNTTNYFGRFTPDHFDVSLNSPVFAPACSNSFTYMGQAVKYTTRPVATVTAKNSGNIKTENYTGSFWKIDPNDATYGITPSYSEASHTLTVLDANPPTVSGINNGTGVLNFANVSNNILGITRTTPVAEFDAEIAMSFSLSDTDGIVVTNVAGNPQTNPVTFGAASSGNGISFGGNKAHRWGRLVFDNAHGSELLNLALPIKTQYFNGTDYINNANDSCTAITLASQLSLSNPQTGGGSPQTGDSSMTIGSGNSSASLSSATLTSGLTNMNFSAPGNSNTGFIDIQGDFSSFPWLLFDWDNDSSHDDSPAGKVTFGIFNGNSKQIYFREVY